MSEPYGRVYLIINKVTGKKYVGQTTLTLAERWRSHVHAMSNPRRTQPVTAALRKYGHENFTMAELDTCGSQEELNAREREWAVRLGTFAPTGYNLRAGDGVGALAESARERLREAMTPERRQSLSDLWRGRRLPDEAYAAAAATFAARRRTWKLLNPQGVEVLIDNPMAFCAEQGLQYPNLRRVAWGLRPSHRGWRLLPAQNRPSLVEAEGRLRCPGCGDGFPTAMRAAALTHAAACTFVPIAVAEAIRLGHCMEAEVAAALAALHLGAKRGVPVRRKQFTLIAPNGSVVQGDGLLAFAKAQGMQVARLSELINGKRAQYKGWRVAAST